MWAFNVLNPVKAIWQYNVLKRRDVNPSRYANIVYTSRYGDIICEIDLLFPNFLKY